jgi:hypothetical protein
MQDASSPDSASKLPTPFVARVGCKGSASVAGCLLYFVVNVPPGLRRVMFAPPVGSEHLNKKRGSRQSFKTKPDAGIGLLQVSDARRRLRVLDGDAEPDMRRRVTGPVPFVGEFLQSALRLVST